MSRYIDVDALMHELEREVELADDWKTAHEIANVVKYFPSADVVEVVRCKDCKYYLQSSEKCELVDTRLHFYETNKVWTNGSFCSWAERRSDK